MHDKKIKQISSAEGDLKFIIRILNFYHLYADTMHPKIVPAIHDTKAKPDQVSCVCLKKKIHYETFQYSNIWLTEPCFSSQCQGWSGGLHQPTCVWICKQCFWLMQNKWERPTKRNAAAGFGQEGASEHAAGWVIWFRGGGGDGICSVQPATPQWVFLQRRLPTGRKCCRRSFSSTTIVRTMTASMKTGTERLKRCSKWRVRTYLLNLVLLKVRNSTSLKI